MNYPRRQQYRRIGRAIATGAAAVITVALAVLAASMGAVLLAVLLLLAAVGLGAYAGHWARLAGRSRVGARSEEQVQRALAPLAAEGWRLRHSLPWQGRGDIDSVAIAPHRVRLRDRDQNKNVRGPAPRPRARDGPAASGPPPALMPSRRAPGPMHSPRQPARARRGRRADRVPGPAPGKATERRGHAGTPAVPRPLTCAVAMSDELLGVLARAWKRNPCTSPRGPAGRARDRLVPPPAGDTTPTRTLRRDAIVTP